MASEPVVMTHVLRLSVGVDVENDPEFKQAQVIVWESPEGWFERNELLAPEFSRSTKTAIVHALRALADKVEAL